MTRRERKQRTPMSVTEFIGFTAFGTLAASVAAMFVALAIDEVRFVGPLRVAFAVALAVLLITVPLDAIARRCVTRSSDGGGE